MFSNSFSWDTDTKIEFVTVLFPLWRKQDIEGKLSFIKFGSYKRYLILFELTFMYDGECTKKLKS